MHSVGDIVYIVSNKKRQVLPAQIVEQINRKTLSGEQIQYQVLVAGAKSPVDLDSLSEVGSIFSSLEDVRSSLYAQAEAAIVQVISAAAEMAASHFPEESLDSQESHISSDVDVVESGETMIPKVTKRLKVKLPDGTSASVSMPDV
jgi:hypothetical protein